MALSTMPLARRPIRPAVLYLAAGVLIGPLGLQWLQPTLHEHGGLIEAIGEIALVVALFCIGVRLNTALEWRLWRAPVRLATLTLPASVLLSAGVAHVLFDLSFAQALLIGAVLAPTDAVLARDGELPIADREEPRFVLTAEGALSSALAFPAVLFGLGLIGMHDLGPLALRWLTLDVLWAAGAGAAFGWLVGAAIIRGVARLEADRQSDLPEELIALVAIALAYGGALAFGAYGFLSVFAASLALAHGGRLRHRAAPRRLSPRFLGVAQRLEQLAEVTVLLLLGAMLALVEVRAEMFLFALLLLVLVRPLSARFGLGNLPMPAGERQVIAWFGIRGAASVFYLAYAINSGLDAAFARELAAITLVALVTSVLLHGFAAAPLSNRPLDQEG